MNLKLKLGLVLVTAIVMVGCSGGDSAPSGSDPAKQIDATAKPTGPRPGVAAGGGAPSSGNSATATPQ